MHPRPSDVDHRPSRRENLCRKNRREPNLPPLQSQVHAVEKLMTVTGTVASSNAPPDKPDDVDVNPARVRHEKDPVNLEQTAAAVPRGGPAPAPGRAGRVTSTPRTAWSPRRRGRNEHRDGGG